MVSYCPAISASQNGPQRAPEVSRQLPGLRNSGAKGNFGAQSRIWDEAGMGTKSHEETWSESVFPLWERIHSGVSSENTEGRIARTNSQPNRAVRHDRITSVQTGA